MTKYSLIWHLLCITPLSQNHTQTHRVMHEHIQLGFRACRKYTHKLQALHMVLVHDLFSIILCIDIVSIYIYVYVSGLPSYSLPSRRSNSPFLISTHQCLLYKSSLST